ncbi:pyocin knob domain-containing protein, partial [Alkanindiges illinoisensis]|uniref:pyocin knob domain-containing protein n=1 Tax=Alkanindiges illinoisensis TaxID=197183 RepID=UPI001F114113
IYFRATTSGVFENWIKLTSEKDLERFLVKPIAIKQNINANDLKTQGTYQVSSTAISNTILNLPEYRSGYLVVSLVNDTNLSQEYVSASNKRYIRHFVSEAWSAWSELVTSVNFRSEFDKNTDLIYGRVGLSFNHKTFAQYSPTDFAIVAGQAKYQIASPTPGSRSVVVKIDPSTPYTVVKNASSRFRLATFSTLPQEGTLGVLVKGEADGHNNDGDLVYFTFTSAPDAQYLVLYVSVTDEAPTSEIYEGTYNGATFNKTVFSRDVEASNIIKSKNIADEREQNWIRQVFRDDGLSGENA